MASTTRLRLATVWRNGGVLKRSQVVLVRVRALASCNGGTHPSSFARMLGANPPSSPTLHASCPYFFLITAFRWWYTSEPIFMASVKLSAPTGRIMNSCIASLLPACEPPLMMLKAGTGRYISSVELPARSAMCLYRGVFFAAAPALHTAIETARMAFAPTFFLHHPHSFCVPSISSTIFLSITDCLVQSMPMSAGPMMVLMFSTAVFTPLPW
mmetsp:Transcript_27075/g.65322  ORF Transcript_27075/g.65322 Transcript_27075/m.65322 type:complete len:213 (-) Transcript_27075:181-819(-)